MYILCTNEIMLIHTLCNVRKYYGHRVSKESLLCTSSGPGGVAM